MQTTGTLVSLLASVNYTRKWPDRLVHLLVDLHEIHFAELHFPGGCCLTGALASEKLLKSLEVLGWRGGTCPETCVVFQAVPIFVRLVASRLRTAKLLLHQPPCRLFLAFPLLWLGSRL